MDGKTTGAWLVHHTSKLEQVSGNVPYDNILVAGKAAILLSALSASEDLALENPRVEVLARASRINIPFELPMLLDLLEKQRVLKRGQAGIDILGVTSATVLERAADLFVERNPKGAELAAIELSEKASIAPFERSEIGEYVADTFSLSKDAVDVFFAEAEDIGFIDHEMIDADRRLYFNGNIFRRDNATKAAEILRTLSPGDATKVTEVDEQLRVFGCLPIDAIKKILGDQLFEKLAAISLYDINVVNNDKENVAFVTRPAAFSKYGAEDIASDALDLAKAFVSSLTYGMTRSSSNRGRITMIEALMRKLIRGEWVGSADAIGEDYRALELRNVVKVRPGDTYGFDMKLLKKDVGEMALAVIQSGDTSDRSLPRIPGAAVAEYVGPEQNRGSIRKKQNLPSKRGTRDMIMALRTGKIS
jgi:hypothetical protein